LLYRKSDFAVAFHAAAVLRSPSLTNSCLTDAARSAR
jgi:hypothetical protein